MANIELPSWADGSWDVATLDGLEIPGLVRVEVKRGAKYDEKAAPGQSGAKVTFKGFETAKVTLTVRLWTKSQEDSFNTSVLPLIDPLPGKEAPKGMSFVHTAASLRRIDGILVEDVDGPKISDDGFQDWTISAMEYRKPAPQQGTPGKGGSECAQLKAEYDYYMSEANRLGSKGISDFDSLEAYEYGRQDYQAALDKAQHRANLMRERGCKEMSPSAGAAGGAAGGMPPP